VLNSYHIQDSSWFRNAWEKDPTVNSMLIMLDAIQERFNKFESIWERLIDDDNPLVSFLYSPMEELGLDDNIYIKMNSRGRPLTEFENFKADFERFLEESDNNQYAVFIHKIDTEWTKFLWDYNKGELVDGSFQRIFDYVAELFYYKNIYSEAEGKTYQVFKEEDISYWKQIFANENAVEYLFTFFDTVMRITGDKEFFSKLNSSVKMFGENPDLLYRLIHDDSFDITQKILFYQLVNLESNGVLSNFNDPESESNDRLRVMRNRLLRVRYFEWPRFRINLRYENYQQYINAADQLSTLDQPVYEWLLEDGVRLLIPSDTLEIETKKAEIIKADPKMKKPIHDIEDNTLFRGAIHNIIQIEFPSRLKEYHDTLKQLSEVSAVLFQALLLTVRDYYGINKEGWSILGIRSFIGSRDRYNIFTHQQEDISTYIIGLIEEYLRFKRTMENQETDTESIIKAKLQSWLKNYEAKESWKYYFVKYYDYILEEDVLFAWENNAAQFEIECLMDKANKSAHTTARGSHINPYIYTVSEKVNDGNLCPTDECYGYGKERSILRITNGVELQCKENGWKCAFPDGIQLKKKTTEFLDHRQDGAVYLKEMPGKDRIEIAVDFINSFK
jgi:hypothetical protein